MTGGWQDISLHDYVTIYRQNRINDSDFLILQRFYLPIIGVQAFSLYQYFSQFVYYDNHYTLSHQNILNHLNIGMHDFYQARLRLEAIGLFKTYQSSKSDTLDKFVIELVPPKSAQQFLSDAIYCGLLVDMVGQTTFDELTKHYLKPIVSLDNYKAISADFYKIYGKKLTLHTVDNTNYIDDNTSELVLDAQPLDWTFFMQLLGQTYIHESLLTVDVRNAIQTIYQLYNLSPIELKEVVLRSHHVNTNEIVIDTLYQIARQIAQSNVVTQPQQDVAQHHIKHDNPLEQLVTLFMQTKSSDFLKMIKSSKNQMHPLQQQVLVTQQELKILEQLVIKQNIPMPVVNVLIHHLLVTLSMDSLVENYVIKMANDWVNHHIATPQDAMAYLKQREENIETAKSKPRKSKVIKEIKMTEEEKNALHDVDTPMSDERRRQILENLK